MVRLMLKRSGWTGWIQGNRSFCASRAGNPEPSRQYTVGRCRDYLRTGGGLRTAPSVLNNRQERPAP